MDLFYTFPHSHITTFSNSQISAFSNFQIRHRPPVIPTSGGISSAHFHILKLPHFQILKLPHSQILKSIIAAFHPDAGGISSAQQKLTFSHSQILKFVTCRLSSRRQEGSLLRSKSSHSQILKSIIAAFHPDDRDLWLPCCGGCGSRRTEPDRGERCRPAMMYFDTSQRIGALGGMALVLIMQPGTGEILKTTILAAVGGVTSYLVTLLIKFLLIRIRRKFK